MSTTFARLRNRVSHGLPTLHQWVHKKPCCFKDCLSHLLHCLVSTTVPLISLPHVSSRDCLLWWCCNAFRAHCELTERVQNVGCAPHQQGEVLRCYTNEWFYATRSKKALRYTGADPAFGEWGGCENNGTRKHLLQRASNVSGHMSRKQDSASNTNVTVIVPLSWRHMGA